MCMNTVAYNRESFVHSDTNFQFASHADTGTAESSSSLDTTSVPTSPRKDSLWQYLWDTHCTAIYSRELELYLQQTSPEGAPLGDDPRRLGDRVGGESNDVEGHGFNKGDGPVKETGNGGDGNGTKQKDSTAREGSAGSGTTASNGSAAGNLPSHSNGTGAGACGGGDDDPPDEMPIKIKKRFLLLLFAFIIAYKRYELFWVVRVMIFLIFRQQQRTNQCYD